MAQAMMIQKPPAKCGLEDLGVELKLAILHRLPDLRTLTSLTRASRLYRDTYLFDRPRVIYNVMRTELSPASFASTSSIANAHTFVQNRPDKWLTNSNFLEAAEH